MKVTRYEVVVMQHQFVPDEDHPEHGRRHLATKSIVHALGYKDAKAVANSLETRGETPHSRSCTICIRLNVWGKSVLLPVHHIDDDMVNSLIDAINNRKGIVVDPADDYPNEDTMHRRLHSMDEVDNQTDITMDWTNLKYVKKLADKFGPGQVVIKYPDNPNYSVTHAERADGNTIAPGFEIIYRT